MRSSSAGRCAWLGLALLGCAPEVCNPLRWGYAVGHGKQYPLGSLRLTSAGIRHDGGDGATIDRLTQEVGDCLKVSIDRSSFVVKVPADTGMSCDGKQQELSAIAPMSGCDAKGLAGGCPCHWRALVQCPNVIVATPSLYLFKDALVRFVTGSTNPWADPVLAKCAAPTTDPLGGT